MNGISAPSPQLPRDKKYEANYFFSVLYMCYVLYYFYIFKNEKTGIAEIKEGITREASERRKK